MQIRGKVFIVTGGTFGIGAILVDKLASKGAKLVLASRNTEQGAKLIAQLESKYGRAGDYVFHKTDVGKLDDIRALMKASLEKFGGFDVLINNAGLSSVWLSDVMKDTDKWLDILHIDLVGPLLASRLAMTHWLRNKKQGLIINTGSLSEFIPNNTDPTYVVAKAGLSAQVSTIKSMGDLKGTPYEKVGQVRAVTIAPGYCWTDIWAASSGGKWTTKAHVEKDPSFGPELLRAGGWTDLDRLVGVYIRVIEDESINGETILVTGDFPVQRVRMHRTFKDFVELMNRKETALL